MIGPARHAILEGEEDMKRRLTVLLCLVLSLLLLTGCASQTISKAKTAYANGDYQAVVDLLEGMKNPKPEAVELLKQKSWPGNIRELDNVVDRLLILGDEPVSADNVRDFVNL